jgi:hypothetical protein
MPHNEIISIKVEPTFPKFIQKESTKKIEKSTGAIFDNFYINTNGPQFSDNITFEQNSNKFILPDSVRNENDMIKMMRIESLLESMNFEENNVKIIIPDPPILKGLTKFSGKEFTKIIKSDDDNNYFKLKNNLSSKIKSPPNFLY